MNTLFLIPARGGSKGVPRKNIRQLNGKPLICYSIDVARKLTGDENICVSTDDPEIKELVENYGLEVPFMRPALLATDTAGTSDVCLHALNYYEKQHVFYDNIVVLQPTSPFRKASQVAEAMELYKKYPVEMVASVKETDANPYFVLFEETSAGYLTKSKPGNFVRRQDCPKVWQFNGAIYVINALALKKKPTLQFTQVCKFEMDEFSSVDIDTPLDWEWAEFLLQSNNK